MIKMVQSAWLGQISSEGEKHVKLLSSFVLVPSASYQAERHT